MMDYISLIVMVYMVQYLNQHSMVNFEAQQYLLLNLQMFAVLSLGHGLLLLANEAYQ